MSSNASTSSASSTADASAGDIIVVGGGHAAAQLCAGLVEAGLGARVRLVCEEAALPYHRPPLSKAFLKTADEPFQFHRAATWYADSGIRVHLADPAVAIDRAQRTVTLRSGVVLAWHRLVLATGTRARRLPGLAERLVNVVSLRSALDAERLRQRLAEAERITVLGGGFIGLEVAATAAALGKPVTLIEAAPRLMGRAVSPALSAHVLAVHQAAGMVIHLGAAIGGWRVEGDRVVAVEVNGREEPVDLLLLAIGAVPETALAEAAGLTCQDGIVVDGYMQTSDPAVLAVGDCTRFPDPRAAQPLRLESVQNAGDQARTAVATLTGTPKPHAALPWFWSEQGAMRLQMAGLVPAADAAEHVSVRRPGASDASFSLLHYVGEKLVCIESVNAPMDHMMSRKLIEADRHPAPALAADPAVALKAHLG